MMNGCVKKINEGLVNFYEEALDLYQQGLEKKWLLEDNVLSQFTYHNIVKAGLKTANFAWLVERNDLLKLQQSGIYQKKNSFWLRPLECL